MADTNRPYNQETPYDPIQNHRRIQQFYRFRSI